MKRVSLEHLSGWLLLIIAGGIVVHAPLTVIVGSHWPDVGEVVKAWKELLLLAVIVLLAVDYTRHKAWHSLLSDKLLWCIAGYALLHLVSALVGDIAPLATVAGLMIDLRFVAFFAAVYAFLRRYPRYRQRFVAVGVAGAAVVVGFACVQQVLPRDFLTVLGYGDSTIQPYMTVDDNPDFVRHSSTLRGPNPLGAYAIMVLAGVVAYGIAVGRKGANGRVRYMHAFLAIGALVALWTSQSRSAWLGALAALGVVVLVRYGRKLSLRSIVIATVAVLVLGIGTWMARDSYFVQNIILHDNPTTGAQTTSNDGHLNSLIHSSAKIGESPLGYGIGSTGSASLYTDAPHIVENQYLYIAHEVGWLGLGLFVMLFVLVLRRLWQRRTDWLALTVFASGIGLALVGVLLPVWADDTVSMVWWGLAGIVIAGGGVHGRQSTKQKTARTA